MVAAGDDEDDDNVAASQDYDYNNYNDVTNFCPSVSDKFIYYDCWVTKIVFLLHFEFQETECIIALGPMWNWDASSMLCFGSGFMWKDLHVHIGMDRQT